MNDFILLILLFRGTYSNVLQDLICGLYAFRLPLFAKKLMHNLLDIFGMSPDS